MDFEDPHVVKVIKDKDDRAIYFSRAAIPHIRDWHKDPSFKFYQHIGLYVYRVDVLKAFLHWPQPVIEQCEKLEQLRFLDQGMKIKLEIVDEHAVKGIDTERDFIEAEKFLENQE